MSDQPLSVNIIDIDINRLEEEWLRQPRLYYQAAKELADARLDVAEAKAGFELIEAELDRKIRADPVTYELGKIREEAVKNCVIMQPEYQAALKDYNRKKHFVDLREAHVSALEHRKKALENMVALWSQSYFANPKVKGESGRMMKSLSEEAGNVRILNKLNDGRRTNKSD